jgi:hypothetical protein
MRSGLFFESVLTPTNSKMLSCEMPQLSLLMDCFFLRKDLRQQIQRCRDLFHNMALNTERKAPTERRK